MPAPGFAVIDFETTGLFPERHDRIVEVAVVHVNEIGRITGQWETLVNPERDLGAQFIHGIRAADVIDAPRFADIAGHLVELLDGRVIVAHNASFDIRFLAHSLRNAGYAPPSFDNGSLCTMQLAREIIPGAGRSLADCCAAFDIELHGAHRASVDARATARLMGEYIAATDDPIYWSGRIDEASRVPWPPAVASSPRCSIWRARGANAAADPKTFLERITMKLPELSGPAEHQDYFACLDRALLDRHLSVHEANALIELAESLGISRHTCESLHREYFEGVARVAWADGVLSVEEIANFALQWHRCCLCLQGLSPKRSPARRWIPFVALRMKRSATRRTHRPSSWRRATSSFSPEKCRVHRRHGPRISLHWALSPSRPFRRRSSWSSPQILIRCRAKHERRATTGSPSCMKSISNR